MASGVYVTFFETGEPFERELPPVGPFDHVVVRHRQLVAERAVAEHAPEVGADIARWLEAELELQRALGVEPGGTKRTELRITAPDGVYVRFAVFGEPRERDLAPELGPYAVVVVGRRGVEADGQLLATRQQSELAAWELTVGAGDALVGLHKPDIAFRSASTSFHPDIAPLPARARAVEAEPESAVWVRPTSPAAPSAYTPPAPVHTEPAPPAPEPYPPLPAFPPPAEEPPALTPSDLALIERMERERAEETLRARILDEERRRLGVDETDDAATTWAMRYRPQAANEPESAAETSTDGEGLRPGALLWRLRFAIIGLLLIGVGIYGVTVIRSGGTQTVPGQQIQTVGIAQKISGTRWDYVVNGVQRTPTAGSAQARGTYYIVRIGVTNKGTEGAQLSPNDFVLIDANGTEYRAESIGGGAYYSSSNTQSQYIWPQSFAVGKTASVSVVFDVSAALGRGNLLSISELPRVRVKLD